MPRKTAAAAVKDPQPDLLGGAPQAAPKAKPIATTSPAKPKAQPASKSKVVALARPPRDTLAVVAEALKDPAFKPEQMRMVLDMHKELIQEQARLDYIAASRAMKRQLPTINRDGKIEYEDKGVRGKRGATLRYATFENIHEVLSPLLHEHGFDLWFSSEPSPDGTRLHVIGHLEHENGYERRTVFPMSHDGSGGKSNAQGWASAFSFGKRVATIGLLNIRTKAPEDRDRDGVPAGKAKGDVIDASTGDQTEASTEQLEVCSDDQLAKVRESIEWCGVSETTFCKHFNIAKVSQLPASDFQNALDACKAFKAKRDGEAKK